VTASASTETWHLITCEYPPAIGGVANFTDRVARGLAAAGATVHVWSPAPARDAGTDRVVVHELPGGYRASALPGLGARLNAHSRPRRLFVQWVPHGYGYKSLNVPFVVWVAWRVWGRHDRLLLMVHEPWLPLDWRRPRVAAAAIVHRVMAFVLLRSATRAWTSIPGWLPTFRGMAPSVEMSWLPVPAMLPVVCDPEAVRAVRRSLAGDDTPLVGHYGTYGDLFAPLLRASIERLIDLRPDVHIVLLGRGSTEFRETLLAARPELSGRLAAAGVLSEPQLSLHVQACDVMLQPYPDGITARRTTATALLAHGAAIVTTTGELSEALWGESGAVQLVARDPERLAGAVDALLRNPDAQASARRRATELHQQVFSPHHTLAALAERRGPA
jgi:Glycosyl transferases group 1